MQRPARDPVVGVEWGSKADSGVVMSGEPEGSAAAAVLVRGVGAGQSRADSSAAGGRAPRPRGQLRLRRALCKLAKERCVALLRAVGWT
jgi:hypothetical protein